MSYLIYVNLILYLVWYGYKISVKSVDIPKISCETMDFLPLLKINYFI